MANPKIRRPKNSTLQSMSGDGGADVRGASRVPRPEGTRPRPTIPDHISHYEVCPDDSFRRIAMLLLGGAQYWKDLAELNKTGPPYRLWPGQRLIVPDYRRSDMTVTFMHSEMIKNAASSEVQEILAAHARARNLNAEALKYYEDAKDDPWYQFLASSAKLGVSSDLRDAATIARLEAKGRWFLKVRAGADWDHKPILQQMYKDIPDPPGPYGQMGRAFHFPIRGDVLYEYYYDVWSNIHYGFVGTKAGFDAKTLQDGGAAGLPGTGGNDEGDVISTDIGIKLWNNYGMSLTKKNITEAIVANRDKYISARKNEIKSGIAPESATDILIYGNDYK